MGWPTHQDEADTRLFLDPCINDWQGNERLAWVIEHDGQLLGMIEAKLKGRNAGIGYVLAPDAWGQGYATEALQLVSAALFEYSPVSAIWALCVTDNLASARVLAKCGYERDALLPGYFTCPNIDNEQYDVWRYVRYRYPAAATQNRVKPV
jgi:ribosomal-protein-alanine N-acetyltransferase